MYICKFLYSKYHFYGKVDDVYIYALSKLISNIYIYFAPI